MKKTNNKFLNSIFVLILSGMSTKVLGMIIKIIFTRIVGTKAISLYTLVIPTYSLLLTICSMAMPTTIAKLISEKDDMSIINNASLIIIILNFTIMILIYIFAPFLANNLLKEPNSYYLIIAMSFTLPFASLACILKGYFYGKQKMVPHVISNTIEQIIRLILIITIIPLLLKKSYVHASVGLILTNTITELASVITFIICMNKKDRINLKKINFNKNTSKDILNLSFPIVSSRIIGNICFFFEPIILTNSLLLNGYNQEYIMLEYGVYNAYSISTLTIPSFFINAISLALLPEITKLISQKESSQAKKRLKISFVLVIILGITFSFGIYIFKDKILYLLYNTNKGSNYIKILAPVFVLFYLENIFTVFFSAISKTKITFYISLISSSIKLLCIFLLSFLHIGIYSLVYSEIINILLIISLDLIFYKKYIKKI